VDPYETLEALLLRLIREAVHDEVRAQAVSAAPLSEAARSSCGSTYARSARGGGPTMLLRAFEAMTISCDRQKRWLWHERAARGGHRQCQLRRSKEHEAEVRS